MNPQEYIAEHVRDLPRSGIRDFFAIVSEMRPLAEKLFTQLGYDFTPIFCTPDGEFPNHDPNPSDEHTLYIIVNICMSRF